MAKYTDSTNNITFNSVPDIGAKGYAGILTNADNISNKKYVYDPDSDKTIVALDIDWCGAKPEIGEGENGITTTGELLSSNKGVYSPMFAS